MEQWDEDFSLKPNKPVGTESGLPSKPTAQALIILLVGIIIAFAGMQWSGGKVSNAETLKNGEVAKLEEVKLESERIKTQLAKLESAGGADMLNSIKKILDNRMNWSKTILAIGKATPSTVYLDGFSASYTPTGGSGAAPTSVAPDPNSTASGGGLSVSFNGTAPNSKTVQTFIKRLRNQDEHVVGVQLNSATRNEDGTVTFSVIVDLRPPTPTDDPDAPGDSTETQPEAGDNSAASDAADALKNRNPGEVTP